MTLEPYEEEKLQQILINRAGRGFKEGVVKKEVLELIASNTGGDARYAIEILWRSGKLTDHNGNRAVGIDEVR